MKDRVSTEVLANGAVRYEMFNASGVSQGYVYMKLADEPSEIGTALNKANLLADATGAKYSLGETGTPNDALNKLATITSITLAVADWSQSGSVWIATKNVTGITANSVPQFEGLIFSTTPSDTTRKNAQKAMSLLYQMETASGQIKFYATAKPAVAITVGLRGC